MFCKYCGKPIDKDSVFCSYCGKQQPINNINMEESSSACKQKKENIVNQNHKTYNYVSRKSLVYCYVYGIGIIIVVCGVLFLSKKKIADVAIDKVSIELTESTKKYDRLYGFHEGLARVEMNQKFGFIDKLGNEIIPCKYDDADDFKFGVAVVETDEESGLINQQGKIIISCRYDNIHSFDEDSTATAYLNGKAGRINITGNVVIPFDYEECHDFQEGLAAVKKNGLYGFIDKNNSLVIPYQYEELYNGMGFSEGFVGVKNGVGIYGDWGYIDKKGKVVIPFNKGLTGAPFSSGLTTIIRGGINYYIDKEGFPQSIYSPSEMAYIDKEGNVASHWHEGNYWDFIDGYARFSDKDNVQGLMDISGKVVIPCEYFLIDRLGNSEGLYWISKGSGKCGYYNIKKGNIAIPCIYDDLSFKFCEGLVYAKKNDKYGFLNSSNEIIIQFNYDEVSDFSEGFAVVQRYGKYGYVDRYGNDTFN